MRLRLSCTLRAPLEQVWDQVLDPAMMNAVAWPLVRFLPQAPFPRRWSDGEYPVRVLAGGLVPIGSQMIRIGLACGAVQGGGAGHRDGEGHRRHDDDDAAEPAVARSGDRSNGASSPTAATSPTAASSPTGESNGRTHGDSAPAIRTLRDTGYATGGMLRLITRWDHRIDVCAHPRDPARTLQRDTLDLEAGLLTLPLWIAVGGMFLWRQVRWRRLARFAPRPDPTRE